MDVAQAELRVVWVGSSDRREFHESIQVVRESTWLRQWNDLTDVAWRPESLEPHLIILAISYPGEVTQGPVERLRARYPLARLICLQGPWCGGERRTGRPLSGMFTLDCRAFPVWFPQELFRWRTGRRPQCVLPSHLGARPDLDREPDPIPCRGVHQGGRVGVVVADRDRAAMYLELLRSESIAGQWLSADALTTVARDCTALLWDGDAGSAGLPVSLKTLAAAAPSRPLVAIRSTVDPHDVGRLRAEGATAVLSKPFRNDDLIWLLCQSERFDRD